MKELNKLVETIKTESTTEKTEVEVLEQGEIPQDSGTGTYQYSSLDELLDSVDVSYPCPIHQTIVDGLKSKREDCDDVLLRCSMASYQSFVIPMTTTIITINVKGRVTPGSPWTEFTRWCANVE